MEHELSQPGWRQYIEKRADGRCGKSRSLQKACTSSCCTNISQHPRPRMIADSTLPHPPGLDEADTKEIVCVTRSESQVGVRWKGADGRVFESDETGMVYGVDSNGERIMT